MPSASGLIVWLCFFSPVIESCLAGELFWDWLYRHSAFSDVVSASSVLVVVTTVNGCVIVIAGGVVSTPNVLPETGFCVFPA